MTTDNMHPRSILIFGAGGHGKVVADAARSAGDIVEAFIDDSITRHGATHYGLPVVAWERVPDFIKAFRGTLVVVPGIGDNLARKSSMERAGACGLVIESAIHSRSVIAPTARLGAGTVVMAGAIVNPDASIGVGVILNTGCIAEHDAEIGEHAFLGPKAAIGGCVSIGPRSLLGVGAVVLPGIRVGADVRVGAGAVVTRNVADGETVTGIPARAVRSRPRQ